MGINKAKVNVRSQFEGVRYLRGFCGGAWGLPAFYTLVVSHLLGLVLEVAYAYKILYFLFSKAS